MNILQLTWSGYVLGLREDVNKKNSSGRWNDQIVQRPYQCTHARLLALPPHRHIHRLVSAANAASFNFSYTFQIMLSINIITWKLLFNLTHPPTSSAVTNLRRLIIILIKMMMKILETSFSVGDFCEIRRHFPATKKITRIAICVCVSVLKSSDAVWSFAFL